MSDISTENISENENTNNVKENDVEKKIEVENIPVSEVKTVKRKYVKRKKVENETIETPPIIKPEIIEIAKTINVDKSKEDKVKINRVEEACEEAPESLIKGGFLKPILIACLASASFYVNNVYSTKKRKIIVEKEKSQEFDFKKKKMSKKTLLPRKVTVIGFI